MELVMKYSIFLVLLVTLLGCEGNIPDDLVLGGYIKQIRNSQTNTYQNLDFNIVYDDDNRVYAINDTVYTYGSNNKVSSSRFTFSQETAGYKYEKDIQKSYKWDVKGRILEIYVERYIEKAISPDGGFLESNPSGYTEAYFSYTGDNSLPDSISLGKGLKAIKVFKHSKGNISQEEQMGEYINFSTSKIKSYTTQRLEYIYDPSIKNHLYPLFTKMGVLPRGLGYITSVNSPKSLLTSDYVYMDNPNGGDGSITQLITYSENIIYNIAQNGYPNRIVKNIEFNKDNNVISTGKQVINLYY
jgi:hypothetical protein